MFVADKSESFIYIFEHFAWNCTKKIAKTRYTYARTQHRSHTGERNELKYNTVDDIESS